jgi:hypothetical protein
MNDLLRSVHGRPEGEGARRDIFPLWKKLIEQFITRFAIEQL